MIHTTPKAIHASAAFHSFRSDLKPMETMPSKIHVPPVMTLATSSLRPDRSRRSLHRTKPIHAAPMAMGMSADFHSLSDPKIGMPRPIIIHAQPAIKPSAFAAERSSRFLLMIAPLVQDTAAPQLRTLVALAIICERRRGRCGSDNWCVAILLSHLRRECIKFDEFSSLEFCVRFANFLEVLFGESLAFHPLQHIRDSYNPNAFPNCLITHN